MCLDIGDKLHDTEDAHKNIKDKMLALHGKIEMLVDIVHIELYPKLDGLRIGSTAGLFNITNTSMYFIFLFMLHLKM